jgi:hypothetical protein
MPKFRRKGWRMETKGVQRFRMGGWASDAVVFTLFVLTSSAHVAFGQWVTYPTPNVPRLADGKPDLKAPAPLQPDGKPDLPASGSLIACGNARQIWVYGCV